MIKILLNLLLLTFLTIADSDVQDSSKLEKSKAAKKPNVVILYSDDAGYADFGFQPICAEEMKKLTGNIDTIARDGVRLSNAYMSGSVCSPSRAGLMTGRYQQRFGYDNNLPPASKVDSI